MGLEQCEERPDRPQCHNERGRPQGEGHRCAPPSPETPGYCTGVLAGSEARLHPGITLGNGTRSLQRYFSLSNCGSGSMSLWCELVLGGAWAAQRDLAAGSAVGWVG